jgi:isoleucyl-tRNA synthetase
LVFKLDEALKLKNKKLIILKESYTSLCDSLALEEVKYHETYKGKRLKRVCLVHPQIN